jgi:hypothetical protein
VFAKLLVPSIAPCSLGAFVAELDPESKKNLQAALDLAPRDVSHRAIARQILAEAKTAIDPETISAHRNGVCRCSNL